MRKTGLFFLFVAVVAIGVAPRGQQGAEKTLAGLKPAAGLEVTLFAAEPMVMNPTDMAIDERGRVWVLEGVNYRRASRQQPDLRPEGDRIVILEDTNRDGKADKSTVFDQGKHLRVPLGIAVLGDKVYLSQAPDLTVYTKDANDKIVKKEVLLTGFNGIDHDHGLHAVVFGWDGKYYFNQGNTGYDVTDKSGKRYWMEGPNAGGGSASSAPPNPIPRTGPGYLQGAVFRMNEDGTGLEVIGHNFRNPYEVAVDSWGNVFQTDNDDDGNAWTRLMYNMEGGNYGFRGPLNKTWIEDHGTHWHQELPGVAPNLYRIGAGSPCGLLVYEGTLLPAKFRGQLFHADSGRRVLAMYPLEDFGAGYASRSEDVLNSGDDTWARPVDADVAPDGSVYVADWYDPGVGGHLMGDPQGSMGRIYRIAPARHRPVVPALNLTTDAGLRAALASPNKSRQFAAYTAIKAKGQAAVPMLQAAWKSTDPIVRARALWLLGGLGAAGAAAIQEAMKSTDPKFRVLGLRVARNTGADMLAFSRPYLRDSSPQVRREIALMLRDPSKMLPPYLFPAQTQPSADLLDALTTLAAQYDGKDRWYLAAIGIAARGREEALYPRLKAQAQQAGQRPAGQIGQVIWELRPKSAIPDLVAEINSSSATAADRTIALETLGHMEWSEAARAIEAFILAPSTPAALAEHAFGLYSKQLFSLWTEARTAQAFPAVMRKAFSLPGVQATAATVAGDLNDPQFLPELVAFARSSTGTPEARAAAIDAVAALRAAAHVADFQALAESGPAAVRVSALRGLAAAGTPDLPAVAQKIVLSDAPNEARAEALRAMATSVPGLNAILDLAEKGTLPLELRGLATNLTNNAVPPPAPGRGGRRGGPLSPVTMRQRGAAPTDPAYVAVRERAARLLPPAAARRIPSVNEIDMSYAGKAADGKKVFDADAGCAACHNVGPGPKKLGPDLTHIGSKYGRQAMLDAIVSPSEGIQFEYMPVTFTLKNGETVSGQVAEDRPDRIVVQIGPNQQQTIRPADVASRKEIRISLMPEGLLNNVSLQQIADLLEYLASLK